MKKNYLKLTAFQILYSAIVLGVFLGIIALHHVIANNYPAYKTFTDKNFTYVSLTAFLLIVLCMFFILKLRGRNLFRICSFKKISLRNTFFIFLAALFMGIFTIGFICIDQITAAFPEYSWYMNVSLYGLENLFILLICTAVIVTCEEIIFRGVMFNEFREYFSTPVALIAGSLLYAVINAALLQNIMIGLFALFAAVCYTLPYIFTGSLLAAVWTQIVCQTTMLLLWTPGARSLISGWPNPVRICLAVTSFLVFVVIFIFLGKLNKPVKNTDRDPLED